MKGVNLVYGFLVALLLSVPAATIAQSTNLPLVLGTQITIESGTPPTPTSTSTPVATPTPNAVAADAFVDSVGINTHLSYSSGGWVYLSTPAPNGNTVISSIETLGIRHLRDSVSSASGSYCAKYQTLSAANVSFDLLASVGQTASNFANARTCLNNDGSFFAIEGANENDLNDAPSPAPTQYVSDDYTLQQTIWNARVNNSIPSTTQIWGTTMGSNGGDNCAAWLNLAAYNGDGYGAYTDYSGLHQYLSQYPERKAYGSSGACGPLNFGGIAYGMETTQVASPGKPVTITETGWADSTLGGTASYVDDVTQAKYTLRQLLAMYQLGVKYEFVYDLADDSQNFGLVDRYLNPKPSYTALENLLKILADPGYKAFVPTSLSYSVSAPSDAYTLLLEKHDGSYWLVVWLGDSSYNQTNNTPISVSPESVTATFATTPSALKLFTFNSDGSVTKTLPSSSTSYTFTATDMPVILEINSSATITPATPQPPVYPSPTPTATPTPTPTATPTAIPTSTPTPNAIAADSFVDSTGVGTHFSYNNGPTTPYSAWSYLTSAKPAPNGDSVISSLNTLGIRHIRDGVASTKTTTYCNAMQQAVANGQSFNLIMNVNEPAADLTTAFNCLGSNGVLSIEGPNEGNVADSSNYTSDNLAEMVTVNNARSGGSIPATTKIFSPSLTTCTAYQAELNYQSDAIGTLYDYNTMHNYTGNYEPEKPSAGSAPCNIPYSYGSLAYWMYSSSFPAPTKPTVTTEAGFSDNCCGMTDPANAVVDSTTKSKYILRTYLYQFQQNVKYTFIYELASDSQSYGLTDRWLNPTPSYTALENLINILEDRGTPMTPGYLNYTLTAAGGGTLPSDVDSMLFEKRDGSFWLVLWQTDRSWDVTNDVPITVNPVSVTLNLGSLPNGLNKFVISPTDGSAVKTGITASTSLTTTVTDMPEVIQIDTTTNAISLATPQPAVYPTSAPTATPTP